MKPDSGLDTVLKVVEIFHSVQGEGANTGKSAVFVRLSHCNKNCWFCDTDWSVGTDMTVAEVLAEVKSISKPEDYPNNLLIWTGGEPTFVSVDDMEGDEWNTHADGANKRCLLYTSPSPRD